LCFEPGLSEDQIIEDQGLLVHFLRIPRRVTSLSLLQYPRLRLARELRKLNPDIVHGHHAEAGWPYYAITSGYPAVAGIHNFLPVLMRMHRNGVLSTTRLFRVFEAYTLRNARYITVDSRHMQDLIRPETRGQISVIPNCVCDLFFAKTRHVETSQPSLAFVGIMRREKGLDTLLKALRQVKVSYRKSC